VRRANFARLLLRQRPRRPTRPLAFRLTSETNTYAELYDARVLAGSTASCQSPDVTSSAAGREIACLAPQFPSGPTRLGRKLYVNSRWVGEQVHSPVSRAAVYPDAIAAVYA
jgi:hypothetical protein